MRENSAASWKPSSRKKLRANIIYRQTDRQREPKSSNQSIQVQLVIDLFFSVYLKVWEYFRERIDPSDDRIEEADGDTNKRLIAIQKPEKKLPLLERSVRGAWTADW